MKFATSKEHRDFFLKNGWIEFEDLISNQQLTSMNQAIDQVSLERLKSHSKKKPPLTAENAFLQGRDLWRSNPELHKVVTHIRFAEIAAELIGKKPLRLGCDQFLPTPIARTFSSEVSPYYSIFLHRHAALEKILCLQGVAAGLIFALSDRHDEPVIEEKTDNAISEEGIDIFPSRAANAIYFQPNVCVDWSRIYTHSGQRFYLIVYTNSSSYYMLQRDDPHTHTLKKLGYVFNDPLIDKYNPIICR